MDVIDELVQNNARFAAGGATQHVDIRPARQLAVVTCMDSRVDVFAALGPPVSADNASRIELDGHSVLVASLDDLISMKTTGRPNTVARACGHPEARELANVL